MSPTAFTTQEAVNLLREMARKAKPDEVINVLGHDRVQLAAIGSTYLREFGGTWRLCGSINELVVNTVTIRFIQISEPFSGQYVLLVR